MPWALPEAPSHSGRDRPGTEGTSQHRQRLPGNPCPPHHPPHPPTPIGQANSHHHHRPSRPSSHPPTTVTTVPPTAQLLVAWLPAPRPQGHIYTNTEGTRSRREYVCFKISVFWPHSHWPKKHQGGGAGVLQVTWWLQMARPGRWVLAQALHSWILGQSLSHGLSLEPPKVDGSPPILWNANLNRNTAGF